MISDNEIISSLKEKKISTPEYVKKTKSILIKALWILREIKDNKIVEALSPQGISNIAHRILDEDINKNSVSKAFSRAGKKIKNIGNGFYEIMGPGREELKKYEDSFKSEEDFKERFYESGDQFDFYRDIKKIISNTKKGIFIVDSYVDEDLFEMYVEKIPRSVEIKILTNSCHVGENFKKIAKMFSKKQGVNFQTRESLECHDRALFIDEGGWVIGNSIKDNAKNKPAYMVQLINPLKLYKIYQRVWNSASKIV